MERENLINAIYENDDRWSCPDNGDCGKSEEVRNACYDCAEKQLKEYEEGIRLKTINQIIRAFDNRFYCVEDLCQEEKECRDCMMIFLKRLKEQKE